VTFWQLGLGEIACPEDMYGQVIKRLKDVARDLEEWAKPGVALDPDWSSAYFPASFSIRESASVAIRICSSFSAVKAWIFDRIAARFARYAEPLESRRKPENGSLVRRMRVRATSLA
jgi:hypothetical protein